MISKRCVPFLVLVSCAEQAPLPDREVHTLPPLAKALTTQGRVLNPRAPLMPRGPNPALPQHAASYMADGLGELSVAPGEHQLGRTLDGSPAPQPGPGARRILRFGHLADMQLTDDESPTRVGILDSPELTDSALRPQEAYLCRMANAAVRTLNALHREDPLSFVILGGDNADSAQRNEVEWVLGVLDGRAPLACDSGEPDDLIPGPNNDGKDPFLPEGLLMPWRWVSGNHDVLIQGNLPVNGERLAQSLGNDAPLGTRDYSQGGLIERGSFVVPDPRRAALSRQDLMRVVAASGDGHGIGAEQQRSGKAFYSFDVDGTPLRFIVLDTTAEAGGAEGVLRQGDVERYVVPLLDEARRQGKWVLLSSHHAHDALTLDGGALGTAQPDALSPEAWTALLGRYDNVLYSIHGHFHSNVARPIVPASGHAYWELVTAAVADFPHQMRVMEVWDGDNGWVMLRAINVDLAVDDDPVAARGRALGAIDVVSGWQSPLKRGNREDRNVDLWIRKPGG